MIGKILQKFSKLSKSDFFWVVILSAAVILYIFIIFQPIFTDIPQLKRYISFDFIHGAYPGTNDLLWGFDIKSLSFLQWDQLSSSGSPKILYSGLYYLPNYLLKIFFAAKDNFLSVPVYQAFVFGHYLIAAIGAFLFLRLKKNELAPSLVGAFLFSFLSFMLILYWPSYIIAIALLPWVLFLLEKYTLSRNMAWFVLASFVAFQQFAINPQFFIYSAAFIVLYFLLQDHSVRTIKWLLCFYLISLAYSAVLLLPLMEFGSYVVRQNLISYDFLNAGATQAKQISQMFLYSDGVVDISLYLGGVAITLIVIFLSKTKSKFDWAILGVAIFFLLFATNNPLIQSAARLMPGLRDLRTSGRANEFFIFGLIFLLVRSLSSYQFDYKKDLKAAGLAATVILSLYLVNANYDVLRTEQLYLALMLMGLFGLVLVARNKGFISDRAMIVLFGLIIILDISRVVSDTKKQMASYKISPSGQLAKTEWFFQANKDKFSTDNSSRVSPDQYNEFDYNKFLVYRNFSAGAYSGSGGEITPAILKRYDDYLSSAKKNPNLLRLINVNTPEGYLSRAFTLNCVKVEGNDDALLAKLQEENFTGDKFLYLEKDPAGISTSPDCKPTLTPVSVVQENDKISFPTIRTDRPTVLFVSDNWYPGWEATVNGRSVEILRANYTFKAVPLSSGENTVLFEYRPDSHRVGGLITLISIIVSLFYVAWVFAMKGIGKE